jgi:Family of unknown function (DUF5335)
MKENIDRSVWINYFNEFTRRNQSRPTHLQPFGKFGAQEEAHGLPFAGIAFGADGFSTSVEIMLGGHDAIEPRHFTHVIENVQQITPKRSLDGRDEALELISGNGRRNLLLFEREARMAAAAG